MTSLSSLLFAFLLGVIALPATLLTGAYFYFIYPTSRLAISPTGSSLDNSSLTPTEGAELDAARSAASSLSVPASRPLPPRIGWLTVRRTFSPPTHPTPKEAPDSATETKTGTFSNLLHLAGRGNPSTASPSSTSSSSAIAPTSITNDKLSSTSNSSSSSSSSRSSPPPTTFYSLLKGTILYLYLDESCTDCHIVIDLQQHDVEIWPRGLMDGELYARRNALRLMPHSKPSKTKGKDGLDADSVEDTAVKGGRNWGPMLHPTPWYIFVKSNSEMEDWYFALKHASSSEPYGNPLDSLTSVFSKDDMAHLIQTLDTDPDPIPMRWLNGVFGRVFLGINKTSWLEEFIVSKIHKKFSRITLPSFLSPLIVTSVTFLPPSPSFSRPMLKDLSLDGEASMEVGVKYDGEVRIEISTVATIPMPFGGAGGRFRPVTVTLVLAVIVKNVEGNLLLRIKTPPSSRIWWGFTKEPRMTIQVEPIVSAKQISWSLILKPIEKQIREGILEAVVLPNTDDIPFFNTERYERGGIFQDAARNPDKGDVDPSIPATHPATLPPIASPAVDDVRAPEEVLLGSSGRSGVGEHAALRKRHATVKLDEPVTMGDSEENEAMEGLPRTGTAPVDLSRASFVGKRSWFGTTKERQKSVDVKTQPDLFPSAAETSRPVQSSNSIPSPSTSALSATLSSSVILDQHHRSTSVPPVPVAPSPHPNASSTSLTSSATATDPIPSPSANLSTPNLSSSTSSTHSSAPSTASTNASSVLSSWKTLATDKQLRQAKLNEAKDAALQRWGAGWGAKKKEEGGGAFSGSRVNSGGGGLWDGKFVAEDELSGLPPTPEMMGVQESSRPAGLSTSAPSTRASSTAPFAPSQAPFNSYSVSPDASLPIAALPLSFPKSTRPPSIRSIPSHSGPTTQVHITSDASFASSLPSAGRPPVPPTSPSVASPVQQSKIPVATSPSSSPISPTLTHSQDPSVSTQPPRSSGLYSSPDLTPGSLLTPDQIQQRKPIRNQMGASAAMRVPGIPSERKGETMSFSSHPQAAEHSSGDAKVGLGLGREFGSGGGGGRTDRLGSVYRLFVGGGPNGADGTQSSSASSVQTTLESRALLDSQPLVSSSSTSPIASTSTAPPPLPSRPSQQPILSSSSTSMSSANPNDEPQPPSFLTRNPLPTPIPPANSTRGSSRSRSSSTATTTSPSAAESLLTIARLDESKRNLALAQAQAASSSPKMVSSSRMTSSAGGNVDLPALPASSAPPLPPRGESAVEPEMGREDARVPLALSSRPGPTVASAPKGQQDGASNDSALEGKAGENADQGVFEYEA